jgi:xanthine dehydrogenase/oxidase
MIKEVSEKLNVDPNIIRKRNFYIENQKTHYNMLVDDWFIPEMFDEILEYTQYEQIKLKIEEFNTKNKWKKRGIYALPSKVPVTFPAKFLHQASAICNIYTDGHVLLHHGGIEMGQGLHTKMIQIAANTLKISPDLIYISDASTDKIINATMTVGSSGTDLCGMAVQDACQQLYERLLPYRQKIPEENGGGLKEWATAAYFDQVNLSAVGFYKNTDLVFDPCLNGMFPYSTNGVCVTLVELDTLTGEHQILSTNIYMDLGQSINCAVDIGQIEGAFMQGVGWCTSEELFFDKTSGELLTTDMNSYKLPSFKSIPIDFNIKLLSGKEYKNLKTIKSSKAVGEPPLVLGTSVYFALREAVLAARKENCLGTDSLNGFYPPLTSETLRLACGDSLVKKAENKCCNKTIIRY